MRKTITAALIATATLATTTAPVPHARANKATQKYLGRG